MGIPIYVPTEFVNDSVPAINAVNLNKTELAVQAATAEVIDLKDNPTKSSETVLGVVKVWTTTDGNGVITGHISTT